ncbi:MAG: hypothetical protein A3F46_06965 [Legionellales bacterium RIFCSPHIGHO2_12_FULL_42_9]|nr:MAG: hypothetical protein A3F46_06965 [Legionellales bacterium RIFCSPHIGHO2_12_FULL_42_9]
MLNPKPFNVSLQKKSQHILIGIDSVSLPQYLDNPQLMIFTTPHQSNLDEYHQWAEPLSSNIQRVLQTNLNNSLHGAAIEVAPWSSDFYPQYHLRVEISEFKVDKQGNSMLRAMYTIETDNKVVHQYQIQLYEKLTVVTPTTIVLSMNNLVNQLSDKIAASFAHELGSRPQS